MGLAEGAFTEQEMMDMKMSLFFFYPRLPWVDGRKCGVISCQSLACSQEDIHAEVQPVAFLHPISLLNEQEDESITNSSKHTFSVDFCFC